jgi:drug/metabolite transporter (DMT)-like permease
MNLIKTIVPKKNISIGIFLVIMAGGLLAFMDAIGKQLLESLDVIQVIWSRYFVQTLVVVLYLCITKSYIIFKSNRAKIQIRRSFALFGATCAMYTSLKYLPLADAAAIQFFAPVLVTIISGIFLGEQVGIRRYAAVIVAFLGVITIMQPGVDFNWIMLLPLITALLMAVFLIQTRTLQVYDNVYTTLFYSTLVGTIILIAIVPFFWRQPSVTEFLLMCVQGGLGAAGHLALIKGFEYATASVLSPFLYVQLLVGVILSVFYLGDPLTLGIVIGATLIVGSGIYIWRREVRSQ